LLVNPYGASLRVIEAIASRDDLHLSAPGALHQVRSKLAELHGLPPAWIVPADGMAELILASLQLSDGPVALFPPTDSEHHRLAALLRKEIVDVPRSHRFAVDLGSTYLDLPSVGVSLIQSPNDPTGMILSPQDAVRLLRKSEVLAIDERHSGYTPRTLIPLVREFDNVVVLRTLETWAGLAGFPFAYAIAPPKLAARFALSLLKPEVAPAAVVAANATLDDLPWVQSTVERVRDEKSRLYRTMRKLNMLRTFPSWANFMMVRIERGEADAFNGELLRRDIHVHRTLDPALADCFRISATTAEATNALKNALIEVAAKL
jgi:histidinol-phosphate aminotransferase